ncbi:MAG: hypothetical protein KTV16_07520 [Acidimicrobiia bacterium]|nr:hypothetical protein [Acidimicrobiia bacterium]
MTVMLAAGCRTPFTATGGSLAGWHPVDLSAAVMNEVIRRGGIDAESVDEVWVGCAEPVGAQGANLARAAVLSAGWPEHIGGVVVEAAETSGSAALHGAVAAIESGSVGAVVVVGVSVASIVAPGASALGRAYGRPWGDGPAARVAEFGGLLPPPRAAEATAGLLGIDRAQQDRATTRSLENRRAASTTGLVPVLTHPGTRFNAVRATLVTSDEHRGLNDDPADLPPLFVADGTVTSYSFAPPVDGAAALLLTRGDPTRATADRHTAAADAPARHAAGRRPAAAEAPAGHPAAADAPARRTADRRTADRHAADRHTAGGDANGRGAAADGLGLAELVGTGRAAANPLDAAGGVEAALAKALSQTGADPSDITRWEITETTAAGFLSVCHRLGIDPMSANPDGGTLGVGHAGAAEELRLSVDGVSASAGGDWVAAISAGTTGSAATLWRLLA